MAIDSYDPFDPPEPAVWLTLGEQDRMDRVLAYHHSVGDRGENEVMHCTLHVIVENQVAMGETMAPVREKLRQLMAQGLDRHQAVHAIAIVLARHMFRLSQNPTPAGDQQDRYFKELRRMNARKFVAMTL